MIKATLYIEVDSTSISNPLTLSVVQRAMELEAEKHGYVLDGEMLIEAGESKGMTLLAHAVKDRS